MRLIHFTAVAAALALTSACQRERIDSEPRADDAVVSVSLSVESETPYTRAGEGDDPSEAVIHNLCILQYRGTTDDATIVREVSYLSDDAVDDEHRLNLSALRLAASPGEQHTVVFLANTYNKLPQVETLGELKTLFRTITSEADVFHPGSPRLNGIAVSTIDHGTVLRVKLRRSVARIRVNLTNDGTDGLAIRQIRLFNVPERDYYLTHYTYLDPSDGETEHLLFPEGFQDDYHPDRPFRTDFSAAAWSGDADGTGQASYTWYVPANLRGTDPSVTIAGEKGKSSLTDGATYMEVTGEYGPAHDKLIRYRFWLGADLLQDFNLRPNGSYTYDINFSGKGDPSIDSRIEDMSVTKFDVDANCYILNPPETGVRRYSINVVHRPNQFWGSRFGVDREEPGHLIGPTDPWRVRLIWSSMQLSPADIASLLPRRDGSGAGSYMSPSQRAEIAIPAGFPSGSILLGVYSDDPDEILWSWHLWITDYSPDEINGRPPMDDTYLYPVTGGNVHRYAGESWQSGGLYEHGFVMDRNLGAPDPWYHPETESGGPFFFQFGRKDPFSKGPLWLYDANDTPTVKEAGWNTIPYSNGRGSVPDAVRNPFTLYVKDGYKTAWTQDTRFNPMLNRPVVWLDPTASFHAENEEIGTNADKSFFDPCPPGWRIPSGCSGKPNYQKFFWMYGMYKDNQGTSTASTGVTVIVTDRVEDLPDNDASKLGAYYYPRGFLAEKNNPDASVIFFPFTSYSLNYYGTPNAGITYWMDSTADYTNETAEYSHIDSYIGTSEQHGQCGTLAIRCIRL